MKHSSSGIVYLIPQLIPTFVLVLLCRPFPLGQSNCWGEQTGAWQLQVIARSYLSAVLNSLATASSSLELIWGADSILLSPALHLHPGGEGQDWMVQSTCGDKVQHNSRDHSWGNLKAWCIKGAQAWDIRERVFYRNQTCTDRWLGDWRKKNEFSLVGVFIIRFSQRISY